MDKTALRQCLCGRLRTFELIGLLTTTIDEAMKLATVKAIVVCGVVRYYHSHLEQVQNIIGTQQGVNLLTSMNLLMLPHRNLFVCDTCVNDSGTHTARHCQAVHILTSGSTARRLLNMTARR
jgi:Phosphate acetyl/butaryl transferase